ncbi:hypothetical protein VIBNISOn1_730025 [Vibrio nigripulchritudo SOn1]|uniref:DUF6701 domain-containing protein n=1 Tax=Vibrio nigripulchritudo SOn1 TaxID=1238450 RepID=A0AAV2VW35_9VIBR|nr:DUF6701 domain-containing protein [Vibrio nigripulchritudo]CCO48964.1 hypothetical protein VIBNISOn1_730025 [Vibrio nigripulchritudo SOn1]
MMLRMIRLVHAKWTLLLVFLLFSVHSLAAVEIPNGSSVNANNGFCFVFNMDSDGSNRIRLENNNFYPLWTDDYIYTQYSPFVYESRHLSDNLIRQYKVHFVPNRNNQSSIKGTLKYYVNGALQKKQKNFNLTSVTGATIFSPVLNLRVLGNQFTAGRFRITTGRDCPSYPRVTMGYDDAQYEFGRLENANCKNGCTIRFTKNYRTEPLVFLMPTLSSTNPEDDKPATVTVTSVTRQSASFIQDTAPFSWEYAHLNEEMMGSISYLVMEPGTATFYSQDDDDDDGDNQHKVVAGYVHTNAYRGDQTSSNPANVSVDYSLFSNVTLDDPIALAQINSPTNRWMTAGIKAVKDQSIDLFLELTRVHRTVPVSDYEKIAFLVSEEGKGISDGVRFEFGRVEIDEHNSSTPMLEGCNDLHDLDNDYPSEPGIIANKQKRSGSHGGWLRRCKLVNDGDSSTQDDDDNEFEVSFVVDEDISEPGSRTKRGHTKEEVGYFAFGQKRLPKPKFDVCNLFPSAAQGWKEGGNSRITMSNYASILNARLVGGQPTVGFETSRFDNQSNCDGGACNNDPQYQVSMPKLPDFKLTDSIPNIWNETVTLSPLSSKTLTIGQSNVTLQPGHYYFESLDINNRSVINIQGKVVLHVQRLTLSNDSKFNNLGNPDHLFIVGYNPEKSNRACPTGGCVISLTKNDKLKGLIYSEATVNLSNSVHIYGAVTALNLNMSNYSKITGESQCFSEPELVITPVQSSGLACDGIPVTFKLVDKATKQLINNYSGTLEVDIPNNSNRESCWLSDTNPATCDTPFRHEFIAGQDAIVTKKLSSTSLSPVHIRGKMLQNTNVTANGGPYQFVPYGFKVVDEDRVDNGKGQVASRPFNVKVSAVASSAANPRQCQTIEDYSGHQSLKMSYELISPSVIEKNNSLIVHRTAIPKGNDPLAGVTVSNVMFTDGVASLESLYSSAGQFKLHVADANWQPVNSNIPNWSGLNGSATINNRPFALSACYKPQGSYYQLFPSGDSNGGERFIAAGANADTQFRALQWMQAADTDNNGIPDDGYMNVMVCLEHTVTGFEVAGEVKFDLHSPLGGQKGVLELGSQVSSSVNNYAPISVNFNEWGVSDQRFRWSEVGSIFMWVEKNNYLNGMSVPYFKNPIGRFYPSHFSLDKAEFTYPDSQNGFVYMNQPFKEFEAEVSAWSAMLDKDGRYLPTLNYGHANYNKELRATFALTGEHRDRLSLKDAELSNDLWQSDAKWKLSQSDVFWSRLPINSKQTYPDKLFNYMGSETGVQSTATEIDLDIKGADPVSFSALEDEDSVRLPQQPDVRYGRMILEDLGTQSNGEVMIPPRTEFWSGEEFIANKDDNLSSFTDNQFCRQSIWTSTGDTDSKASLNESGRVTSGFSDELMAKQNAPIREQVRLWLRMGSGTPEKVNASDKNIQCIGSHGNQDWLKYNWRGKGDEIPSAVITFGTYRGNDRIIYRGEPRLTGR